MEQWSSYALADLLMFSPTAYFRLYEMNNIALWPLQLVMLALACGLLLLSRSAGTWQSRLIAPLLGLPWALVAWQFLYLQYGQINLAAPWFAAVFALQALLLFSMGIVGQRGLAVGSWSTPVWPGLLLFIYALLLHPLIWLLYGRSWQGIELFGSAPDPTALATLGLLLMGQGRSAGLLCLIPLLWCLVSGLTFLAMELELGLVTPLVALLALLTRWLLRWRLTISSRRQGAGCSC